MSTEQNQMPVFKPKRLAAVLIISHLLVYVCWVFIRLSWTEFFEVTFNTESGRIFYLIFLACIICGSLPYHSSFERDNTDRL